MTDDFVITPNPSQQARYRTRCGFPSELRTPGSAAIDLKRRNDAALAPSIVRGPDVRDDAEQVGLVLRRMHRLLRLNGLT